MPATATGYAAALQGQTVTRYDDATFQIIYAHPPIAGGLFVPVTAVRADDDGRLVPGFGSLADFLLDAGLAAIGEAVVFCTHRKERQS